MENAMNNDDLQSLRRAFEAAAERGTAALEAEWKKLAPDEKRAIKPYTDALKMQAAKVDGAMAS
jgi:hypothetical protein